MWRWGKRGENTIKPMVLLIMDGYGVAPASEGNAVARARKPYLDYLTTNYPVGKLIASGEPIGLPANEAGSSEVGHLIIGAGRVVYQGLPRINKGIEDGTFFKNEAFLGAIRQVQSYGSTLHLVGLTSTGNVHSSTDHLMALLELAARAQVKDVKLHLFTDGRDASPQAGLGVVDEIERRVRELGVGRIATVVGRYYAMDRDGRWERTSRAYEVIVSGSGMRVKSAVEGLKTMYARGLTDEFVEGLVVGEYDGVGDNDGLIFFNFRVDRARQLAMALGMGNFESLRAYDVVGGENRRGGIFDRRVKGDTFKRSRWPSNLYYVTMSNLSKEIPVAGIAFPAPVVMNTLAEVVSKAGLRQLHIAESEKEKMVGFDFDGLREEKFPGEEWLIVPSAKVPTYDKQPEMSARGIASRLCRAVREDKYHFIVANFANPDMVAHSGNLEATVRAIEFMDKALGEIGEEVRRIGGSMVITADHGNAEDLKSYPTESFFYTSDSGGVNTEHSNNPVPIVLVSPVLVGSRELPDGNLADVAPTVLDMMGLSLPVEMTGKSLVRA